MNIKRSYKRWFKATMFSITTLFIVLVLGAIGSTAIRTFESFITPFFKSF